MIHRRDILLGGVCASGALLAQALRPRRSTNLLARQKMEGVVPVRFPGWSAAPSEGLVKPKIEGLAASLYNEIVQRTYIGEAIDAEIMLLVAYGGTQSDVLQLHRPEVCYPALGFAIESKSVTQIALPGGGVLPAVRVVAVAGERRENILYWTRLGEDLPTSGAEQRKYLLQDAMAGFIPDGVLVRTSLVHANSGAAFNILSGFVPALLAAVPGPGRPSLVGTRLAAAIARAKP